MKKKVYLLLILCFVSFFSLTQNIAARSYSVGSWLSYQVPINTTGGARKNTMRDTGFRIVGGSLTFCVDYAAPFRGGPYSFQEREAVSFLRSFKPYSGKLKSGQTEQQTKDLVKRMGIIKYFFYDGGGYKKNAKEVGVSNPYDLNSVSKYFLTSSLIWEALDEYYGWAKTADGKVSFSPAFGNAAANRQALDAGRRYYEANKDNFDVSAVVLYHGGQQTQILFKSVKKKNNYDYSLDAACVNCTSTNSDSKAAVIQDTTNWKAITESSKASTCKNVPSYYKKNDGSTYCREEYHIYYPNANNKIKVETGRFFTVNETKEHLDVIDGSIPNFAPIRVKKIRQCKGGNLNTFKVKSDNEFKRCGGTINLKYDEGTYKLNKNLVSTLESFSSNINGDMLQQEATFTYTLPLDTYRYVRIQDGYSLRDKPADADSGLYNDLKVSNLPISFNNVENNPKISFKYVLPNASTSCGDVYSSISKAYTSKNDYLTCTGSKSENVYVKETADEKLSDSACAKLFNSTTGAKFNSCRDARKTNKMGNCYSVVSGEKSGKNNYYCDNIIIDKCDKDTAGSGKYKDQVWDEESGKCVTRCSKNGDKYIGPDGKPTTKDEYENKCCTKETHESIGRDWNEKDGKCCEPGTIYDKTLKVCVGSGKPTVCTSTNAGKKTSIYDFTDFEWVDNQCCNKDDVRTEANGSKKCEKCDINNYKSIGRDWNDNEGKCCPVGYKYYSDTKRCEPERKTKCDTEHLNCEVCCEDKSGRPYCGIVLNVVQVCPGAGKPEVSTYRNIDATNPFLSQTGTVRTTGDNWCNNSVDGSTPLTCSGDPAKNSLIKTAVTDKSNVSEDNAMYVVDLNSSDITAIRNYNKKNEYDDFDLSCKSDGTACKSEFLSSVVNTTGKCANVSKASFYKCAN